MRTYTIMEKKLHVYLQIRKEISAEKEIKVK